MSALLLLAARCPGCGAELTVAQPPERGRCWACRRWLVWNPVQCRFNEEYMTDSPTPWPAVRAAFEQFASAVLAAWDAWKAYLRQLFAPRLLPQSRLRLYHARCASPGPRKGPAGRKC